MIRYVLFLRQHGHDTIYARSAPDAADPRSSPTQHSAASCLTVHVEKILRIPCTRPPYPAVSGAAFVSSGIACLLLQPMDPPSLRRLGWDCSWYSRAAPEYRPSCTTGTKHFLQGLHHNASPRVLMFPHGQDQWASGFQCPVLQLLHYLVSKGRRAYRIVAIGGVQMT